MSNKIHRALVVCFGVAAVGACVQSLSLTDAAGSESLDEAIAAVVLARFDTYITHVTRHNDSSYWAFALDGISSAEIRKKTEATIRSRVPLTAPDTITARQRRSIYITDPVFEADSVMFYVAFQDSWTNGCTWRHDTIIYDYVLRKPNGSWRVVNQSNPAHGLPAPPPPPGTREICSGPGNIRWR